MRRPWWFYEGAGVYRHVWITKHHPIHIGKWESIVRAELDGNLAHLSLSTVVENKTQSAVGVVVTWKIVDAQGSTISARRSSRQTVAAAGASTLEEKATVRSPQLWSIENPHLYFLLVSVIADSKVTDAEQISFGIRFVHFDPAKGLSLNGQPVKIQGTCNHQDHAGVGVALPDAIQRFRLSILRDMGCNAVRTSHNMPTPEWVEACDRAGVMMMCETRQMSSNVEGM